MKSKLFILVPIFLIVALILWSSAAYEVSETQQVIITQFGKPIGNAAVTKAGIHFHVPFVQKPNYFEKRFLEWDGDPNRVPTKDKRFIQVDTFARWRISDPLKFFQRLSNVERARTRLDDILDGTTRDTIAKYMLIDIVRSSGRTFEVVEEVGSGNNAQGNFGTKVGRARMMQEILEETRKKIADSDLGISIEDFRFKRINYDTSVQEKVFTRMISERERIAQRYLSEGAGEAARIDGEREYELLVIRSEAYKQVQGIKGAADAAAADIYAQAYGQNAEFYSFMESLNAYRESFDEDTTLLLTTENEFLKYLGKPKKD